MIIGWKNTGLSRSATWWRMQTSHRPVRARLRRRDDRAHVHNSREVYREEQTSTLALLRPSRYWQDLNHNRCGASNLRRRLQASNTRGAHSTPTRTLNTDNPPPAQRIRRPRHRRRPRANQAVRRDAHAIQQELQAHHPRRGRHDDQRRPVRPPPRHRAVHQERPVLYYLQLRQ